MEVDEIKEICIFSSARYCQVVPQITFNSIKMYESFIVLYSCSHLLSNVLCFAKLSEIISNYGFPRLWGRLGKLSNVYRTIFPLFCELPIYTLYVFSIEERESVCVCVCVCVYFLICKPLYNFWIVICFVIFFAKALSCCEVSVETHCFWYPLWNTGLNLNMVSFILYSVVRAFIYLLYLRLYIYFKNFLLNFSGFLLIRNLLFVYRDWTPPQEYFISMKHLLNNHIITTIF